MTQANQPLSLEGRLEALASLSYHPGGENGAVAFHKVDFRKSYAMMIDLAADILEFAVTQGANARTPELPQDVIERVWIQVYNALGTAHARILSLRGKSCMHGLTPEQWYSAGATARGRVGELMLATMAELIMRGPSYVALPPGGIEYDYTGCRRIADANDLFIKALGSEHFSQAEVKGPTRDSETGTATTSAVCIPSQVLDPMMKDEFSTLAEWVRDAADFEWAAYHHLLLFVHEGKGPLVGEDPHKVTLLGTSFAALLAARAGGRSGMRGPKPDLEKTSFSVQHNEAFKGTSEALAEVSLFNFALMLCGARLA